MNPHKLYIEQISYNGETYTRGTVRDTYATWSIVCSKSPFKYADAKDVATRNWLDEHGEDVYIPSDVKLKKFDAEFMFLCNGTEANVKSRVKAFLRFLMGKSWKNSQGNTISATGSRLVVFDEYNGFGWKDMRFKSFSTDGLVMDNGDSEVILEFKVVFEVFDPFTEITVATPIGGGDIVLTW